VIGTTCVCIGIYATEKEAEERIIEHAASCFMQASHTNNSLLGKTGLNDNSLLGKSLGKTSLNDDSLLQELKEGLRKEYKEDGQIRLFDTAYRNERALMEGNSPNLYRCYGIETIPLVYDPAWKENDYWIVTTDVYGDAMNMGGALGVFRSKHEAIEKIIDDATDYCLLDPTKSETLLSRRDSWRREFDEKGELHVNYIRDGKKVSMYYFIFPSSNI
jgi:hypothetical protein